jgi:hypothetical protein
MVRFRFKKLAKHNPRHGRRGRSIGLLVENG